MRRRRCAVQRPCLREFLFQLVPPLLVFGGALLHVGKVPAPGYFVNKRFELALALHLRLVIDKEAESGIEDLLQVQRPHRQLQLLLGSQASQAENIVYTIKRDLQRLGLIWRRGRFGICIKELDDAGCKQLFLVRLGHGECSVCICVCVAASASYWHEPDTPASAMPAACCTLAAPIPPMRALMQCALMVQTTAAAAAAVTCAAVSYGGDVSLPLRRRAARPPRSTRHGEDRKRTGMALGCPL